MEKFALLALLLCTCHGAEPVQGDDACRGADGQDEKCLDAGVVQGSSMLMTKKTAIRTVVEEGDDTFAAAPFGLNLDSELNVCFGPFLRADGVRKGPAKCIWKCTEKCTGKKCKGGVRIKEEDGRRSKKQCSNARDFNTGEQIDKKLENLEEPLYMADFYWPKYLEMPESGWPAIVGLHGAGGSRRSMKYLAEGFGDRGYMFVPMDWKIDDGAPEDVQDLAVFLGGSGVDLPAETKVDSNRIYLYGYSYGGHVATETWFDIKSPEFTQKFSAVVIAAGVNDKKYQGIIATNRDETQFASIKPALFIGCDDDFAVAANWATDTVEELKAKNRVAHRTIYYTNCGHYPMNDYKYYDDIVTFFDNVHENKEFQDYAYRHARDSPKARVGRWEVIDHEHSCETNNDGVEVDATVFMYKYLACQGKCLATEGCVAVDYMDKGKSCNIYKKACTTPTMLVSGQVKTAGQTNPVSFKWVPEEVTDWPEQQKDFCVRNCEPLVKMSSKKRTSKCKLRYCAACHPCVCDKDEPKKGKSGGCKPDQKNANGFSAVSYLGVSVAPLDANGEGEPDEVWVKE